MASSNWNESHEKGLLIIHKYSNEMYKKYHANYNKYKISLQRYRIPIIILSSIGGFLSISNSGYIPAEYNKWVSLMVGFTNLLVSLVSLIENFKKINDTLIKSQESYLAFKRINDEISLILRIPREERDDDGHVILLKYFQLFENTCNTSPILKDNIIDMLEIDNINEILTVSINKNNIISELNKIPFIQKAKFLHVGAPALKAGKKYLLPEGKTNKKNTDEPIKTNIEEPIKTNIEESKDIEVKKLDQ